MKLRLSAALICAPAAAWAQGAVVQSGVVVPGNFAAWSANGILRDGGVSSISLNFPIIASGDLLGNCTGSPIAAQDTSLTCLLDTLGTAAQGDILFRGASHWQLLAPGTLGQYLQTQGSGQNPTWAAVTIPTYSAGSGITVSGTTPSFTISLTAPVTVTLGGTGLTAGTSGAVPYFNGVSSMASSALLGQHAVMLGGGAGAAPYTLGSNGTSGQVLTSNGASADPSWTSAAAGTVTSVGSGHGLTGGPITSTGTIAAVDATSGVAGIVTPDTNSAHYLSGAGTWTTPPGTTPAPLVATTGAIAPGSLAAGTCGSGTVAVASSTTAEGVVATPASYPGDGITWMGYVSTAGTVTVKVCNFTSGALTPASTAYNVRVVP